MIRPICSVCIATFNGEKYINEQLKSILAQLSADDEIIISDDGSTDQTIEVIESFADRRVKIFYNGNKKGPIGNFENAISNASGEYIFLADQDDTWLNGKIEKHIQLHAIYDLVISDAVVVNEAGLVLYPSFFKERNSKKGLLHNLTRNTYIGCCMSFNRKIVKYALPFPKYLHMHDWWIGLVAEVKGNVVFCDEKLMNYARHENNASPTLGNSQYSIVKRLKNRLNLAISLCLLVIRK